MNDEDRTEFYAVLLALAEVYEKTPTRASLEIYWSALRDLPLADVKSAIARHVADQQSGKFMPRPADLRRKAAPEKDPLIAWKQVTDAMIRYGRYRTVSFEDGAITAVIRDMGGWAWICDRDINQPWTQQEFERRYSEYRRAGVVDERPLIGITERENPARDFLTEYLPERIRIAEPRTLAELSAFDQKQITKGEPK